MVLPLAGIAIASLAGGIGGMGLSQVLGGSKKDAVSTTTTTTYGQVYHAAGEVYSPSLQYAPQMGYSYVGPTYVVNSPYANVKKEALLTQTSEPSMAASTSVPQSYETSPSVSQGIDTTTIIIVAGILAVGVVGFGLVSNRGGK